MIKFELEISFEKIDLRYSIIIHLIFSFFFSFLILITNIEI